MYAKDGAVKCCGHVSRDQDRVQLSFTKDARLNMEMISIIKTLRITDSTNLIEIHTSF